jgi:DNA polymerase III epsilon subunit-like protein
MVIRDLLGVFAEFLKCAVFRK